MVSGEDFEEDGRVFDSCCEKLFCDRCSRIYMRHFLMKVKNRRRWLEDEGLSTK